ncbi:MAG TPA: indole-3-glycerol phosphate synthase TrpC [Ktedonobacterales bacterium]
MADRQDNAHDTILDRIVAATRADLAERHARIPLDELRERAAAAPAPRRFATALRPRGETSARLIAEVKRASPSKGLIAETFDPVAQSQAYERGGAAAISVLTEPRFFAGSLEHLAAVRSAVSLPVLRKDFIFDPYQVYEGRAAGADALLLICALLDDIQLDRLLALSRSLGMEALIEAHDADEVRRAVAAGARVIGVNSRDLRTFAVDTDIVRMLRPLVPNDGVFVAESGIADALGAARARAFGADTILVGEALMRAADPEAKARELATASGGGAIHAFFAGAHRPFVKLCGLTMPEQLRLAAELGADAYGLVFAPQAPDHRRVTPDAARELTRRAGHRRASSALPKPSNFTAPLPAGKGVGGEVRAVGVFVNEEPRIISQIAEHIGLDAIQLSGDETPEECVEVARLTGRIIIKAVRPRSEADLDALDAYALAGAVLLVDTPKTGEVSGDHGYGGHGKAGNWQLASILARRWPIILAGGLTPENVADAIAAVQPRGVDVSSGVESVSQGGARAKDPDKIARFVAAARNANPAQRSDS